MYTYDKGGSLSKPGSRLSFEYNANGIRTKKTVNGIEHNYYVNGTSVLLETIKNGANIDVLEYVYDNNGEVCGLNYNGTTYLYVKNLQGDVIRILDGDGRTVVRYVYNAWGKVEKVLDKNGVDVSTDSTHIGNVNPIRYRSYYYDRETQLFLVTSRYYDPETGRFISPDDISYLDPSSINGLNLYAYCGNDPVNYYDPSGHFAITAVIGLSTATYYAILALLTTAVVVTTAYIESETHVIQNSLTVLGIAIVDVGDYIGTGIDNIFSSNTISSNNINNAIIGSPIATMSNSVVTVYNLENIYYYKRKKVAPRIKSNSKKKAREKAFLKGGKRSPIHHPNGKHGPHFHPNDPRFSHWHYYYLWLLLFGDDEE